MELWHSGVTPRMLSQVEWGILGGKVSRAALFLTEQGEGSITSGHKKESLSSGSFCECQPGGSRGFGETEGTEITSYIKRKALDNMPESTLPLALASELKPGGS